jgi:hypothetical protein
MRRTPQGQRAKMTNDKSDEECAAIWATFGESFESAVYVMAYWEGRRERARQIILCQGRIKFGPPTSRQQAELVAILNLTKLEALGVLLLTANTWDELLADA